MEHSKTLVFSVFRRAWIGTLCLFVLTACKQPEEHPENLDQIYSDLKSQQGAAEGKVEAQKKKIEDLATKLTKYGPRDPELKQTAREKENLERGLVQLRQEADYLAIRAEQRRLYDKETYMVAFKADKPWPNPDDFKEYQENKRLRNANRDWDKSVPVDKSHNRVVEDPKKKPEAKKAE